jgi:hypothetical protein
MAKIHTIATLGVGAISSQASHGVTWKRCHGLPSAANPAAVYVLVATPEGQAVSLGTWPYGSPIILARGEAKRVCVVHSDEVAYSPATPIPKQPKIEHEQKMGDGFMPGPAMHPPDVVVAHVATMSFYSRLHNIYAACQRKPRLVDGNELCSLITPPGDFQVNATKRQADTTGLLFV